jgi:hypothetical protein
MQRFSGSGNKAKEAHVAVYGEDGRNAERPSGPQQARPKEKNKGSWTHEMIAAAAGFEAMRTYERHQAKQTGQPPNHSIVKGILAGLAAAAVDRLIETKGLDWIDAQRAKTGAARAAENMVEQVERGNGNSNQASYNYDSSSRDEAGHGRQSAARNLNDRQSGNFHLDEATTSAGEYKK